MKIKVETLEEVILKELSGDVEYEKWFGRILPFLKKISELEEKNEALEEKNKELGQFEGTELINKELKRSQNKISELRNIFGAITRAITVEDLYGKINQIGELLNFDLSEQIGIIKQINEDYREIQNEINTLRFDKERIEIQWVQLQKENERKDNIIKSIEKNSTDLLMSNEELREKISKLEDTNRKLSGELLNQTEEIHMLEEEIDILKSANDDLKRLNRQIQENVN